MYSAELLNEKILQISLGLPLTKKRCMSTLFQNYMARDFFSSLKSNINTKGDIWDNAKRRNDCRTEMISLT